MNNKIIDLAIVFFGGFFGIHKFIKGETKLGFFYLFTMGGFGIGWMYDIYKVLTSKNSTIFHNSLMDSDDLKKFKNGELPIIYGTNLNLSDNEYCCYVDKAYTFKDKTITTGYTGRSNGASFRIAKGISYRIGGSGSKAIRQTQRTTYYGILYVTNKRVIYSSENLSFDKTFDKITHVQEAKDGIIIQIGSNTYSIITKTHSEFIKAFYLVKIKESE